MHFKTTEEYHAWMRENFNMPTGKPRVYTQKYYILGHEVDEDFSKLWGRCWTCY